MITELKDLWQEAFADPEIFTDHFFRAGYAPNRCQTLLQNEQLAAALYWFDVSANEQKLAYIYAVATKKKFRGQGFCRQLMEKTHRTLQNQFYTGAILVPGEPSLFTLYEKLGYQICSAVREFTCAAGTACAFRPLTAEQYAQLRKPLLPTGSVLQEGPCLAFLESFCGFWAGEDWLLAGTVQDNILYVQEYLGPEEKAPNITAALGAKKARFRMPGADRPFAMYLGFTEHTPPNYFGLALD